MSTTIDAPLEFMQNVAHLHLAAIADQQLQRLMDANTNGLLSEEEQEQLAELVEWSESISLLRAQALHSLENHQS